MYFGIGIIPALVIQYKLPKIIGYLIYIFFAFMFIRAIIKRNKSKLDLKELFIAKIERVIELIKEKQIFLFNHFKEGREFSGLLYELTKDSSNIAYTERGFNSDKKIYNSFSSLPLYFKKILKQMAVSKTIKFLNLLKNDLEKIKSYTYNENFNELNSFLIKRGIHEKQSSKFKNIFSVLFNQKLKPYTINIIMILAIYLLELIILLYTGQIKRENTALLIAIIVGTPPLIYLIIRTIFPYIKIILAEFNKK